MIEEVRLREHRLRHNFSSELPWQPPTAGWRRLWASREAQLRRLADVQQRWDGWTDLMQAGVLVPNFTRLGFSRAPTPPALHRKLRAALDAGLAHAAEEALSAHDDLLLRPRPKFISQPQLNREAMEALLRAHEEWSGVRLQPVTAYGLRVYTNGSTLLMHHDKVNDHVISSIVHVGHEGGDWPLVIEGFDGRTYEVELRPGEMLFYESSKCLHGRPRTFRGRYYASIFVHYMPVDWGSRGVSTEDAMFAVPPSWLQDEDEGARATLEALGVQPEALPRLALASTALYEPECEEKWCALGASVRLDPPRAAGARRGFGALHDVAAHARRAYPHGWTAALALLLVAAYCTRRTAFRRAPVGAASKAL
ncbi:hypothetical protein AB1Y20_008882 [Prymnesium parvum]|uniref:Fe2OG dioxygenase domain-containing protein n=1 Tax=Prymnesium parvum TaxID=97485 RepID=A0AB34IUN2_PRYPA